MIQKLATLLIILCASISLKAQNPNKRQGFSKEEFRERQESFLTEKAGLTKDEAARFFPVYFELQDLKKKVNERAWKEVKKGKSPDTTESEYEKIIEESIKARIETDKLDLEYLQKFKKILSAKKIYKLQHAEMKFHRNIL